MATYTVNRRAIAQARRLIDARQYVLDSDWGEVQPRAADENAFLKNHKWDEYATWHLGLTDGRGRRDESPLRDSSSATSGACTAAASSRAITARQSGGTRKLSSPRTTCCSISTASRPD